MALSGAQVAECGVRKDSIDKIDERVSTPDLDY